eukprot:TRINITY_DN11552_c0_g1_i14.p1 TRINITY_DN11552_c0_g1~~TRINITY_DN11552_c0_g1_i14.p1  ORF type:complete len:145 (+),score=0.77 TRINITY_DN11552_c0_g1_i14:534-968(+)
MSRQPTCSSTSVRVCCLAILALVGFEHQPSSIQGIDDVPLVARVLDENAKRLSARTCQTPVGTPMYEGCRAPQLHELNCFATRYLSPEQAKGDKYGQSVDIWALGCLLYELIQLKPGRGLFQRITNDSMIKVSQLSQEDQWQAC